MSASAESAQRIQRIGAYAICLGADGTILLSRYTSGTWGLPGGGLDHGEHPEAAVVREVAEETGYDVKVQELIGVHSATWTTSAGKDIHAVSVVYRAEIVSGELRPEIDGSSDLAGWIPLTELGNLPHTALLDDVLPPFLPRPQPASD